MARPDWRLRPLKLSHWLRACTAAILLLFISGIVLVERNGQERALLHAEEQTATLAHSLSQHAGDTFQMGDLALVSLARLLGTEPPTRSKLSAVSLDMSELLLRVPRIHNLDYFEESGWRLASSQRESSRTLNQSRSPFFRFHQQHPDAGLFVGPPIRADGKGPWLITLSRRISKDDGSFSGVLVATIESSYFANFYRTFDIGADVRVVLLGSDGKLLARNPHDDNWVGRDMSETEIFKEVRWGKRSGTIRMPSPIEGDDRISAFHTIDGANTTVIFSLSRNAALAPWRQGIYVRGLISALLAGLLLVGGLRLAAQVDRRQASEKNLLQLSRTDALTGLLNRRAFDQTIATAWLHCVASGRPLSLVMIDVDCFKAFNDTYGHPAGDTCLQIVALSIRDSVHYPDDRVMRYGGEEIVVILPETSPVQAFAVAQQIHMRISGLKVPHSHSTVTDHITVSIGCATERPDADGRKGPGDLLADADRALYEAKLAGRNRVVSNEGVTERAQPSDAPVHLRLIANASQSSR